MSVEYYYEYVHLKVKRVIKARYGNPEFFVADVQCVDEHGHMLEPLQNVVCSLDGFVHCLEEEFSEEEIAALRASGVSDPPRYQIYNEVLFRLTAVRQSAELPGDPLFQVKPVDLTR
jgi:hypothetical protein